MTSTTRRRLDQALGRRFQQRSRLVAAACGLPAADLYGLVLGSHPWHAVAVPYTRRSSNQRPEVLSPDAVRALAAAITAVAALRHDPGTPNVIGEVDQARAALRQLNPDDLIAEVLDQLLIEVVACRLASKRHSPRLDAAIHRALILARAEGQTPSANGV
jgi:hypothetical protein